MGGTGKIVENELLVHIMRNILMQARDRRTRGLVVHHLGKIELCQIGRVLNNSSPITSLWDVLALCSSGTFIC